MTKYILGSQPKLKITKSVEILGRKEYVVMAIIQL